ncbi:MAG: DsrE family protein [Nitrospirae bacterium]|nr:DsrE family protein [Nitrospirota bacterium]
MEKVAMILRKPPYGDTNAAEALRHALGGVSGNLKVALIMVDGGVLLARKGQNDEGTGFTNLEATLNNCREMGIEVFVDSLSLLEQSLEKEKLVDGVRIVNESDIAAMLEGADRTMIF